MPTRVLLVEEPSTGRGLTRLGTSSGARPRRGPVGSRSLRELKEDGALFQSSILRGVNRPSPFQNRSHIRVAGFSNYSQSTAVDVSSSPRLLGYCFMLLASIVVLVSAVKFYEDEDDDSNNIFRKRLLQAHVNQEYGESSTSAIEEDGFISSSGGIVFRWKLNGAITCSSIATAIFLMTVMFHFDKWVCPKRWAKFFRDGSKMEGVFLAVLVIYWMICIHVCTGSFSVGTVQPNVYFATWLGFIACVLNVDIWRLCAGLKGIEACCFTHDRSTTRIWVWLSVCSLTASLALVDKYYNRDYFVKMVDGEWVPMSDFEWATGFAITWSAWAATIVAIAGNTYVKECRRVRVCGRYELNLEWRFMEGLLAAGMAGLYMWVIFTFTGTAGLINEPGNGYFGVWGSFFYAVSVLGTWIKENQDCLLLTVKSENQLPTTFTMPKEEQSPESALQVIPENDDERSET